MTCHLGRGAGLTNPLEQLEDCQAQRVRDDLQGVQRRVRVAVLDAAQVGLIEAALLSKLNLTQAPRCPEFADACSEALGQGGGHA